MFYHYDQNNSGGSFDFTKGQISVHVIIEASSPRVADARAEDLGIYFDGCEGGRDCHCCGDRWSPASNGDATKTPMIYGQDVSGGVYTGSSWMGGKPEGYIHYLDGRVVPVMAQKGVV